MPRLQLSSSTPHRIQPNARTVDTVRAMKDVAERGAKSLDVRGLVEDLCKDLPGGDYTSEVLAMHYWACRRVRYMRDPLGVELLKHPKALLASPTGDCDDIAAMLASMLLAAGNPAELTVVAFQTHQAQPIWSHVFVQVPTPFGRITLDPVANRITPQMHRSIVEVVRVPVGTGQAFTDAGVGTLNGRAPAGGTTTTYSVWDYPRGIYRYYEGGRANVPPTGSYRKPRRASHPLGLAPEDCAHVLPGAATKTGEGEAPRGVIAATGHMLELSPSTKAFAGGLLVGGLIGWAIASERQTRG